MNTPTEDNGMIDITNEGLSFGYATVPFDEENQTWVAIGGGRIKNMKDAEKYARRLDHVIRRLIGKHQNRSKEIIARTKK